MGRGPGWTAYQTATLLRLYARGAKWNDIEAATGRSVASCKNKISHPGRLPEGSKQATAIRSRDVTRPRWTPEKEAELIHKRDVERLNWIDIDGHFGRAHGSSSHKYHKIKQGAVSDDPRQDLPPGSKPGPKAAWTQSDMTLAQSRWHELFVNVYGESAPRHERFQIFESIGRELKRSGHAVEHRMRIYGASFGLNPASKPLATPVEISQAMVEREARRRAEAYRSITASFFGDPAPGYSALDQRRQQCTGAPRDI
jgi:hypothetical protein